MRWLDANLSQTVVYVDKRVASDSQFLFEAEEDLWIRIDPEGERCIVEAYQGQDDE